MQSDFCGRLQGKSSAFSRIETTVSGPEESAIGHRRQWKGFMFSRGKGYAGIICNRMKRTADNPGMPVSKDTKAVLIRIHPNQTIVGFLEYIIKLSVHHQTRTIFNFEKNDIFMWVIA